MSAPRRRVVPDSVSAGCFSVELKRDNPQALKAIAIKLETLNAIDTKVGWFRTSHYEDGTPVAYAAALNELGHGKTPPRPFFRPTVAAEQERWKQSTAVDAKAMISGTATPMSVMEGLGQRVEKDVLKTIVSIHEPALSPVTIELRAMKKRDPNLVITGAVVGEAARRVAAPGYKAPAGVSTKPLNDSGVMIARLTHITESKS